MSTSGRSVVDDGPPVRVMAEVPHSRVKKDKPKNPQQKIDEFWGKYTTKAPGKGELL